MIIDARRSETRSIHSIKQWVPIASMKQTGQGWKSSIDTKNEPGMGLSCNTSFKSFYPLLFQLVEMQP
jgi:hypothetical protein